MSIPYDNLDTLRSEYFRHHSADTRQKFLELPPESQKKILIDFANKESAHLKPSSNTGLGQLSGNVNELNEENSGLVLQRTTTTPHQEENTSNPTTTAVANTDAPTQEPTKRQKFLMQKYERVISSGRFKTAADYQRAIDRFNSGEMGSPDDYRLVIQRMNQEMDNNFSADEVNTIRNDKDRLNHLESQNLNREFVDMLLEITGDAGDTLQKQITEQGAAAHTWDAIKSVSGVGDTMEELLDEYKAQTEKLLSLRGRIDKIENFEFDQEFGEISSYYQPLLRYEFKQYKKLLGYESAIKEYDKMLGMQYSSENLVLAEKALGGIDNLKKIVDNYDSLSAKEKFQKLREVATKGKEIIQAEHSRYWGGKSAKNFFDATLKEDIENMKRCSDSAKFQERVNAYCQAQEEGAGYVKTGAMIVASTAIIMTGGLGAVGAGLAVAGTTAGIEIADRATNGKKGDLSSTELLKIGKNAAIDGALTMAGGKLLTTVAATGLNSYAKVGIVAAGEGIMGAAGDYGKTGEVTVEGVAFNMLLGGIGAAAELRAMKSTIGAGMAKSTTNAPDIAPPKLHIEPIEDENALKILFKEYNMSALSDKDRVFSYILNDKGEKVWIRRNYLNYFLIEDHGVKYRDYNGHYYSGDGELLPKVAAAEAAEAKKMASKGRSLLHNKSNGLFNDGETRELSRHIAQFGSSEESLEKFIKGYYSDIEFTDELIEIAKAKTRYRMGIMRAIDGEIANLSPSVVPHRYYRGVTGDHYGTQVLANAKVGDVITPDYGYSYASTSLWTDNEGYAVGGYLLEIITPPGMKVSQYPELWRQVLFPRNVQYEVVSKQFVPAKHVSGSYTKVVVKAVGTEGGTG